MKKNISTYALVSQLWHQNSTSLSDILSILLMILVKNRHCGNILRTNIHILQDEFVQDYGVPLPRLHIQYLFNKAIEINLASVFEDYYVVKQSELASRYPTAMTSETELRTKNISLDIVSYIKSEFGNDFKAELVENELWEFLEKHGQEVLELLGMNKPLSFAASSDIHRFIAKFISDCSNESLETICSMYIAVVICAVIELSAEEEIEVNETDSRLLRNCRVYLDTPILIPLMGASDENTTKMYQELVEILIKAGAKICTFKHIVDEVDGVLSTSLQWVKGEFIRSKASRAAKYFYDNQSRLSHLELLVNDISGYISKSLCIEIIDFHLMPEHYPHVPDVRKLEEIISLTYSNGNLSEYFEELTYNRSIEIDIRSISAINALRNGVVPRRVDDYHEILVTKNWGLVQATKNYNADKSDTIDLSWIVLVDCYLSAILWNIQEKPLINEFYKRKLINACIDVVSPPREFLIKYAKAAAEYADEKGLDNNSTKALILKSETSNSTYIKCGDNYQFIYETIEETVKRNESKLTAPLLKKIAELEREKVRESGIIAEQAARIKSTSQENKQLLKNQEQQKIVQERKNKDIFIAEHHIQILSKYYLQPALMIAIGLFLLSVLLGLFINNFLFACTILPIGLVLAYIQVPITLGYKTKKQIEEQYVAMKYLEKSQIKQKL